jgi:transcriptional regulator with XRE-family HTH domain
MVLYLQGVTMKKNVAQEGLPDDVKTRRRIGLGRLLREARHAKEWILEDVAKKAGISVPFLSDLERGKRVIGPKKLQRLTEVLGITGAAYARAFQLRQRLPPRVERWFLAHAEAWGPALK